MKIQFAKLNKYNLKDYQNPHLRNNKFTFPKLHKCNLFTIKRIQITTLQNTMQTNTDNTFVRESIDLYLLWVRTLNLENTFPYDLV